MHVMVDVGLSPTQFDHGHVVVAVNEDVAIIVALR